MTEPTESAITYRRATDADIPQLLELWNRESQWGELTEADWREWYRDTPFGDALVALAENEAGVLVGQAVLVPGRVVAGDREVAAFRLSAPIVRREWRSSGSLRRLTHPAIELYLAAHAMAMSEGAGIIYSLPDASWLPVLRRGESTGDPRALRCAAAIPAVARSTDRAADSQHFVVDAAPRIGEEFGVLWNQFRAALKISTAVMRSPAALGYRIGPFATVAFRDATGALVGFAAVNRTTGLITELMASSEDLLVQVLLATCAWAREALPALSEIKALASVHVAPSLRAAGFEPVDFTFGFAVCCLNSTLPPSAADPNAWHVAPSD